MKYMRINQIGGAYSARSIVFDFNLHTPHLNTGAPSHLKGYLLAAAAAVLWGFSGVVTKYLLRRQMRPDELLVFRTLIAAAILVVWLGLKSPQLLKVRRADILSLILLGVVGLTLNQGFYYLSLTMVSVGYSLLLQYLAPVHLMVYGVLSKTERMTGGKIAAAFTAICRLRLDGPGARRAGSRESRWPGRCAQSDRDSASRFTPHTANRS